jgi:hypothetical protein
VSHCAMMVNLFVKMSRPMMISRAISTDILHFAARVLVVQATSGC